MGSVYDKFEPSVDSKLELAKAFCEVSSEIKENVSSDFVLTRLTEKEQEYVVEMTNNAYYLFGIIKNGIENCTEWKWDRKSESWKKYKLDEDNKTLLINKGKSLFQSVMVRPTMVAILNRNKKDNFMIRWSLLVPDDVDEDGLSDKESLSLIDKVKEKFKNGGKGVNN